MSAALEDAKRRVRQFIEGVWNAHGASRMGEFIADDAICEDIAVQVPMRGLARWRVEIEGMLRAFPDLEIVPCDQIAEGDQVCTRWRGEGTHRGPYQGVEPTGRRIGV